MSEARNTIDGGALEAVPERATPFTHAFDEEVVVYHADTRTVTELNQLGGAIWQLIDGKRSVAALCDLIQEYVTVERPVLEADVQAFLARMLDEGLICYRT